MCLRHIACWPARRWTGPAPSTARGSGARGASLACPRHMARRAARCRTGPSTSRAQSTDSRGARHSMSMAPMPLATRTRPWRCSSERSRPSAWRLRRRRCQTCCSRRSRAIGSRACKARPWAQRPARQPNPAAPRLPSRIHGVAPAQMPAPAACWCRPGAQCPWFRASSPHRPLRPGSPHRARLSCRAWARLATPPACASPVPSCTPQVASAALPASSATCVSLARRNAAGKRSSSA
mmetsp:Transcript_1072/g.3258  ORF Transcript_1072/g.3258 Transcript_1072/m.3258 type:complete len:237 (+) Transcript_1072:135-845(+)